MASTPEQIAARPGFVAAIQQQSNAFLQVNEQAPRLASIFATQQRWLMAHIGLSLNFRARLHGQARGLDVARFIEEVSRHDVASRNTAASFLAEMVKYKIIEQVPNVRDRRLKVLGPTPGTLEAINLWVLIHLTTLDGLDGGSRKECYMSEPDGLLCLQPLIADGLLASDAIRDPSRYFAHFMWLNNGFLITERLIAAMQAADEDQERIVTTISSMSELATGLSLSRTHAARKVKEAEAMGAIGWQGERGRSPLWVSREFRQHFMFVQAAKLAIIDEAFEACFPD